MPQLMSMYTQCMCDNGGNTWSCVDVLKNTSGIVTDTNTHPHTSRESVTHTAQWVSAGRLGCKCRESPNMPDGIKIRRSAPC